MDIFEKLARKYREPDLIVPPQAPGWNVAALNLPELGTVSGKGETAETARASCLAEAAEISSLRERPGDTEFRAFDPLNGATTTIASQKVAIRELSAVDDPGSEGAAAGITPEAAARGALLERLERHAVAQWARGLGAPHAIPEDWLDQSGLSKLLNNARDGSQTKRITRLLLLETSGAAYTILALSHYTDGTVPIIGTAAGATPLEAARAAISELLQLECSYALAMLAQHHGAPMSGHTPLLRRIARLETDRAHLLQAKWLDTVPEGNDQAALSDLSPEGIWIADMTREDIGLPVFRCYAPGLSSMRVLRMTHDGGFP